MGNASKKLKTLSKFIGVEKSIEILAHQASHDKIFGAQVCKVRSCIEKTFSKNIDFTRRKKNNASLSALLYFVTRYITNSITQTASLFNIPYLIVWYNFTKQRETFERGIYQDVELFDKMKKIESEIINITKKQ